MTLAAAMLASCWSLQVVDGDTIRCDGRLMRLLGDGVPFVSGIDTPELRSYRCDREKQLALKAAKRLRELVKTPGVTIEQSGAVDTHDRPLVRLRLPGGSLAENLLLEEGLARPWAPGRRNDWCGAP